MLCATSHSCSEATQAPLMPTLALDARPTQVSLPRALRVQIASTCLLCYPSWVGLEVLVCLPPPY